jgi:transposase
MFEFDLVKTVQRLLEIREVRRQIEAEERAIKERLERLLKACGGRLIVGGYLLSLGTAETFQYGKIVDAIRKLHPELESELSELSEKFKTTYNRIAIERLS